jgi:uncharacterized protein (UPF0335 family)
MGTKKELKDNTQADMNVARGAMREIIDHNRRINNQLVEQMEDADFSLLEEYSMITKGILEAAKLLTEINAQTPKTIKDIEKVEEEKKKIDLDSLMDSEE